MYTKTESMEIKDTVYVAPEIEVVNVETESGLLEISGTRSSYGKAQEQEWD